MTTATTTCTPERSALLARVLAVREDPAAADPCADRPVRAGTVRDYDALARFHYRAGRPATIERVLCIDARYEGQPAAVLVVSRPTLNAAWRRLAWPGRYDTTDKSLNAARVNAELRTISRVVIDPRYRSLGLATRLVRHYLGSPITPHTEAVAAMGAFCPFFERAGMTPVPSPTPAESLRLRDALAHLSIPVGLAADAPHDPLLERELRRWARARPSQRHLAQSPWRTIALAADAELLVRLCAYAHTAPA